MRIPSTSFTTIIRPPYTLAYISIVLLLTVSSIGVPFSIHLVWESEEWLKEYAKPLAKSGGVGARAAIRAGQSTIDEADESADGQRGEAMEE